jgi:hypothetical protein
MAIQRRDPYPRRQASVLIINRPLYSNASLKIQRREQVNACILELPSLQEIFQKSAIASYSAIQLFSYSALTANYGFFRGRPL